MSRRVLVPVIGKLDMVARMQRGTLVIDRDAGIISVRPHRRHRVYELPLSSVAEWVCHQVIRIELQRKKAEKRAKRKPVG